MINVQSISKSFGNRKILDDVSLTVQPGQITCLIGPSGSGKTTLLRSMALLETPDSGRIEINGKSFEFPIIGDKIRNPPWPEMTVVFQSLFLWPHLSLRDNVMLPAKRAGMANLHQRLHELIDFFEMGDFIHRYPNEASRGQQQRVALARALMLNPKYVLLDEITSALDVEQVAKVLMELQKLRDTGISIFVITHLLGFAKRASDQVLFLNDGKIEEAGGPEILTHPQSPRLRNFVQLIEAAS